MAIGASTGGVEALQRVLADFPRDCPPTLVVQHMKADFLPRFHERLASACKARVVPATDDQPLVAGHIYVASSGHHHLTVEGRGRLKCRLIAAEAVSGHRPSVDALFRSLVPYAGSVVAALLTGMGKDGAEGLRALRHGGAHTIAQDEATSVVFGMPRAAIHMGAACAVLPLQRIGAAMIDTATGERVKA